MCLICTGCITHREQHKSVPKPKDINLHAQEGCAGLTCARAEQPRAGTLSRQGNVSAGCGLWTCSPLQPRTHCQPSERVRCFPPPFFFFIYLFFFSPPALAKETSSHDLKGKGSLFVPGLCKHGGEPLQPPTRTDGPTLLDAAGKCQCPICPKFPAAPAQL